MSGFRHRLHARWGDMDFNGHMRNTAYLDASGDVRLLYFAHHGFSIAELARLRVGPVILRDDLEYFRELHLHDPIDATLQLAGLSADGTRFRLRNEFFRGDGKLACRVTSTGGWLDHGTRRLTRPPEALRDIVAQMPRSEDFAVLELS